jgi:hypothetical protein
MVNRREISCFQRASRQTEEISPARSGAYSYLPDVEPAGELAVPPPIVDPAPAVPAALLGGPALGSLAGERPWLGPLFPVVLPLSELPVVVELAACPPEAELPPADDPAPDPPLCANAVPEMASAATNVSAVTFMWLSFLSE